MASKVLVQLFLIFIHCVLSEEPCDGDNEVCAANTNNLDLHRIATNDIGDIHKITLDAKEYEIKTISVQPLAFEISNYLSNEECDEMIGVSQEIGLESSTTRRVGESRNKYQILDKYLMLKTTDIN